MRTARHPSGPGLERLQTLLTEARQLSGAEAGTIFLRDRQHLHFAIAQNDVLTDCLGDAEAQNRLTAEPLSLEERSIASYAALTGSAVNVADVYAIPPGRPYTFNARFDLKHAYRTRSVLAMPLRDARGTVFGVLQLINRRTEQGDVVAFDDHGEAVVRGLVTTSELG